MVPLQPGQSVDDLEPRLGPVGHRDGHRAVELDHRRGGQLREPAVEEGDLRPVRRLLVMERRDRSLQLVGARNTQREPSLEGAPSLLDPARVPEVSILVGEQHELSGG